MCHKKLHSLYTASSSEKEYNKTILNFLNTNFWRKKQTRKGITIPRRLISPYQPATEGILWKSFKIQIQKKINPAFGKPYQEIIKKTLNLKLILLLV